jgi:hypothetical protein
MVVQQLQLIYVGVWQQIAAHREHLPEFEKSQTQFLEGLPHLLWRRPMSLAKQCHQNLASGQYAQDLHETRSRSPQAALLRFAHCIHVVSPQLAANGSG